MIGNERRGGAIIGWGNGRGKRGDERRAEERSAEEGIF